MKHSVSAALLSGLIAVLPAAQAPPDVADVLKAVARYVADYERQISAVVSEEEYVQRTGLRGVRHLKSDMLVINDEAAGWVGFRDVFEVDGSPVRDRDERLKKLFLEPSGDAIEQALKITLESARYNLAPEILRTINIPFRPLLFVSADRQHRSRFKIDGVRTIDGIRAVVLKFEEVEKPRIIQTTDDAPTRGRFWIDPESGRVLRTELQIDTAVRDWNAVSGSPATRALSASFRTTYGFIDKLDLWMPVEMEEDYRVASTFVEGRATYSNFRRFSVDTNTIIK